METNIKQKCLKQYACFLTKYYFFDKIEIFKWENLYENYVKPANKTNTLVIKKQAKPTDKMNMA